VETPDLDLLAFEFSLPNTANPPVIERIPFPESVSSTQDRQPIVEFNIGCHNTKKTLCLAAKQTIGTQDD